MLVVARRPLVRAGLRALLAEHDDIVVAGQIAALEDLAGLAFEPSPDVALAAWATGEAEEVVALAAVLGASGMPLVLVGDAPEPAELAGFLRAGVRGVLLSDASAEDLSAALRAVVQGLVVLDPLLGRSLPVSTSAVHGEESRFDEPLTGREREVLDLLALGLPNKTIAKRLGISEHTVKFHVGSIFTKLGAASRTEAVTRAARQGLLAL